MSFSLQWSNIPMLLDQCLKLSLILRVFAFIGGKKNKKQKNSLKLWGQYEHWIELNNLLMGKIINGERVNMVCEGVRGKAGAQVEGRISSKSYERFNSRRSREWQCLWRHATNLLLNYVWHLTVFPLQFMYCFIKSIKWRNTVLMELLGIKATTRGVCLGSLSKKSSVFSTWHQE